MRVGFAASVLLISSCVSMKDYKAKVAELDEFTQSNKDLRKEIRNLEKENKIISDTIEARLERAKIVGIKLQKALAANDVKVNVNVDAVKGLTIQSPVISNEDYAFFMGKYKSREMNSAKNITWLTEKEKQIYYYLNFARMKPREFCNKYVLPKLKYDSSNIYVLTLIDYMYAMRPMNALIPDKNQFDAAKCHAQSSGKTGYVGHTRQTPECKSIFSGECCSYGLSDPLGIVLQLLIDEGVTSLGHRYICLGWYEGCGISMQPHTSYGTNVVLDFR